MDDPLGGCRAAFIACALGLLIWLCCGAGLLGVVIWLA